MKLTGLVPEIWMVTVNGVKYRDGFWGEKGRREAEVIAERTQGRGQTYGGTKRNGLLKHKDFGDHVEVKRDYEAERIWKHRFDEADRGNPQRQYVYHDPGAFK